MVLCSQFQVTSLQHHKDSLIRRPFYHNSVTLSASSYVPIPTLLYGSPKTSVPPDLRSSEYVFIRSDAHRTPLQHPYEGLFHVLGRGPKSFTIDFGGKPDTISVDRLSQHTSIPTGQFRLPSHDGEDAH